MTMTQIDLKLFASALASFIQCKEGFKDIHEERIEGWLKELPSGSGLDAGVKFDWDKSTPEKLIFQCDFHHMDQHGYYDGWSEHKLIITPSLQHGFNMRITGRDRNEIKDYLYDVFNNVFCYGA